MNWRPWVVTALMICTFLVNVAMLWNEKMTPPDQKTDPTVKLVDPLLSLRYTPQSRIDDFHKYGMTDDMVDDAQRIATETAKNRTPILQQLLKDHADVATRVFCPGNEIPQRYAALGVLTYDDGDQIRVMDASELTTIAMADWYATAQVGDVYTTLEVTADRHDEATVMGVASILLGEEDKVIEQEDPWGAGGLISRWSYAAVLNDYANMKIRDKEVRYFALMHVLTELANADRGVCN